MGSNKLITFDISSESDGELDVWDVESVYGDMVKGCLIKCIRCTCKQDASNYGVNEGTGDRMKNCDKCNKYLVNYRKQQKLNK